MPRLTAMFGEWFGWGKVDGGTVRKGKRGRRREEKRGKGRKRTLLLFGQIEPCAQQ